MLAKKQNFLEKIVKRNYNNELEKLLEEKQFEENAKSTLLNILYKIETGYKDIEKVKKDIETKEEYIENLMGIIKNNCNSIKILKMSEQNNQIPENRTYIIDKENKEIIAYPIERKVLYAIAKIGKKEKIVSKEVPFEVWTHIFETRIIDLKELYYKIFAEYDKKYFENIMRDTAESTEYQFALGKLSAMLAVHYKSKVIIIIDEYDTPIQQGYLHGYYDSVVGFMRNLFSAALKDNENLEFGVLTGILRIAKESLFSGLNNLVVNTILDEKYSAYFGFTPQEVQEMSIYYGKPEKVQEIKDWYDGYLFGRQEIYNPWSVINYFSNDCKSKAFWSRTSGNEIIGQMIRNSNNQIYENLTLLLQGKEVQAIVDTDIIYPEIDENSDAIYSFLLVSGYLRVTNVISEMNDTPICSLAIPNREIKSVFQKEIMDQNGKLFTGTILRNFEMSLRTGDADLFTNTLQNYLMQSVSCFDTAQENFYHGMVFGMLAIMTDKYYISSNREAGDGRLDIQLEPKEKNQKGYIIEFKAGKELAGEQLEELAGNAIAQIYDKNYLEEMRQRGITEIGLFGIGFSGKHVVVKYENNVEGV